MNQVIQIIGGLYRGKKIAFPDAEHLRPTPNRVRETLFNWLMHDIKNARCLDAFAGSGALGLEAFSRGAAKVTFVEQAPTVFAHLKKISKQFASSKLHIVKDDFLSYVSASADAFDIVFLDPPFSLNYIPQCLDAIFESKLLANEGLVYIEAPTTVVINEQQWLQIKSKKAGQVVYGLLKKRP